ncbi:hypothetical protein [Streptococcus equinus]|uniref:hypothetical protein n=1 Tax=Streptococcus equinus TaxID=1335 RepID=UPI001144BC9E|nr:hypothetical protein [Streptococcus equinus]
MAAIIKTLTSLIATTKGNVKFVLYGDKSFGAFANSFKTASYRLYYGLLHGQVGKPEKCKTYFFANAN